MLPIVLYHPFWMSFLAEFTGKSASITVIKLPKISSLASSETAEKWSHTSIQENCHTMHSVSRGFFLIFTDTSFYLFF